jgi:hypothetical protein
MTYRHTQKTWAVMWQRKILICKLGGAVNGAAASAVAIDEIATLNHEIFDLREVSWKSQALNIEMGKRCRGRGPYHTVELATFVALRLSLGILALTRAELSEVLCRLGSRIGKELHFDPPKSLTWRKLVSIYDPIFTNRVEGNA